MQEALLTLGSNQQHLIVRDLWIRSYISCLSAGKSSDEVQAAANAAVDHFNDQWVDCGE